MGCRGCCCDPFVLTSATMRSASGNGSPLNMPPLTTQNTVVLEPDTQPEREHRHDGKRRVLDEHANTRANVRKQLVHMASGEAWMATRYVAGGNNVPRFSVKMFEGIRPFKRRMRAFYASALPPWGVMRPIVALVLLSSVAAVGSVLKAQERAPTGAPPTFAARAAGSSSGPPRDPDPLAGRGLRNPGQAVPGGELLRVPRQQETQEGSQLRGDRVSRVARRRTAIAGTTSCRSCGPGTCRPKTSRSRPSTSGRRLRPGSRASSRASKRPRRPIPAASPPDD